MQEISQKPKYTIRERMVRLDGTLRENIFEACTKIGVSQSTFYNWMNTPENSKFSIPTDQFYKLASFLNCNPTELQNG